VRLPIGGIYPGDWFAFLRFGDVVCPTASAVEGYRTPQRFATTGGGKWILGLGNRPQSAAMAACTEESPDIFRLRLTGGGVGATYCSTHPISVVFSPCPNLLQSGRLLGMSPRTLDVR